MVEPYCVLLYERQVEGADYTPRGGLLVDLRVDDETGDPIAYVLSDRQKRKEYSVYEVWLQALRLDSLDTTDPQPASMSTYKAAAKRIFSHLANRNHYDDRDVRLAEVATTLMVRATWGTP